MKSKAAVAWEPGKPLSIETVEVDAPKEGEVLLRVVASGVCHTDAFTLSGEDPEGLFPVILGHEGGAVVEENGLYDRSSSDERHTVTCSHHSRRFDHGVHARAGELTGIADLKPVVPSERPKDVGVHG